MGKLSITFYTDAGWFHDGHGVTQHLTIADALYYVMTNLRYLPKTGKLYSFDGSLWCEYDHDGLKAEWGKV